MPELPEVETAKNGITPAFMGHIIESLILNRPNLRIPFPTDMKERLEGQKCINLRRRGKYIWIDFENNLTLVIHLGMSGSLTIDKAEQSPHDHVIFTMRDGTTITYNDPRRFGMMFFVKTNEEHKHKAFSNMGPEPLGNDLNTHYLIQKLKTKKSPIKTALLDQEIIAGIGNIYACEALYRANISPLRPSNNITEEEAAELIIHIRDILNEAIVSGGSSLRDHRQADGTLGYFQHIFDVYDREGEKCKVTGDKIIRIIQSGRSTFYCPEKQM
jgi:formamidopyrimidine-DNA glycosylase